MTGALSKALSCRRGSVAVETALVGFALIALLLGTFEFGRGLWAMNELQFAAEAAARAAIIDPSRSDDEIEAVALAALSAGAAAAATAEVTTEPSGDVTLRTVSVVRSLRLYVVNLTPEPLTLSAARRIPVL